MMAMSIPSCPSCGGTMRSKMSDDSAQCRCGFTIDGYALARAASRSTSLAALNSQMLGLGYTVSPPDAKPGIHISENYAELSAMCWDPRLEPDVVSTGAAQWMRTTAIDRGATLGLSFQNDEACGAYLVVKMPDGTSRNLERHKLYALAPFGGEFVAARQMVEAIAAKRGPGHWWSLLDPVHRISDDGMINVADVGGVPHVFMRALYCHLPTCPLCGEPCDRVEAFGVKVSGCPCVGDKATAIAMLNDDLKAGRIKVPAPPVWDREYLGDFPPPTDPLDVEYDGVTLRHLIEVDEAVRQERNASERWFSVGYTGPLPIPMTPAQRAAVSAHWSAELRNRIAAAKERDRRQVVLEVDE